MKYNKLNRKYKLKSIIKKIPVMGNLVIKIYKSIKLNKNLQVIKIKKNKLSKTNQLLCVQRIINIGLSPEKYLEDVQAELIAQLNDKKEEFEVFNQLPIECLIKFAEGKTAVAGHYSHLISDYAAANKVPDIESIGIEPARLPELCRGKETLIIANSSLASLVIASEALLADISGYLSCKLVLIYKPHSLPVKKCNSIKNIEGNIIISDNYFRNKLHKNGFFDVYSTGFANHGMYKNDIKKTRYDLNCIYKIINEAENYKIINNEVICYNAFRLRKTDN